MLNLAQQFIIDVHQSVTPGNICFIPLGEDSTGTEGAFSQLASFGTHPPIPDAEIIGVIWEGNDQELEKWMEANWPWLEKLNMRRP